MYTQPLRKRRYGMNEATSTCPKCQAEIPLTESLAAPLVYTENLIHI